jgi:uncharacterized protein
MQILFVPSAGPQTDDQGSSGLIRYLKSSLGKNSDLVCPEMPEPENPMYFKWKKVLEKEMTSGVAPIVLVGHSFGGSVLLKYISEEKFSREITGLFLVAVPFWGQTGWEIDEFLLKPDFELYINRIPDIYIYHSCEDQWVPFVHLVHYSRVLLNAKIRVLQGKDHEFFKGLPQLTEDLINLEKNG